MHWLDTIVFLYFKFSGFYTQVVLVNTQFIDETLSYLFLQLVKKLDFQFLAF